MLLQKYRAAVDDLYKKIRDTQTENIEKAGRMIADSVASGGCVYFAEICHKIQYDMIYRGGGPIFYKHFNYSFNVESTSRERDRSDLNIDTEGKRARLAIEMSNLRPGDILFVSSVSGRTPEVVELCFEAVKFGIKVIAFTSMEFAVQVAPVHSSGKKLYEMATLTIDNCAPAADAMVDVEGLEARFAPASGIASDYILWNITAAAIEELMARGITPGILKSLNFPGGNEYNKTIIEPNYEKLGW